MTLLEQTGVGRDINRRRYGAQEVLSELQRPLCADLIRLIRLRNTHPAFRGVLLVGRSAHHLLALRWQADSSYAELIADFATGDWTVRHGENGTGETVHFASYGAPWAAAPRDLEWCG